MRDLINRLNDVNHNVNHKHFHDFKFVQYINYSASLQLPEQAPILGNMSCIEKKWTSKLS